MTGTLAGCVAGLAVVAGCSHGSPPQTPSQSHGPTASSGAPIPSPTAPTATTAVGVPVPASPAPAAVVKPLPIVTTAQGSSPATAVSGRLAFSGGCFYLKNPSGGGQTAVVWPLGYTARTGPLGVYDEHGALVGRPGDVISLQADPLSLASVPTGAVAHPECLADAKTALFVS